MPVYFFENPERKSYVYAIAAGTSSFMIVSMVLAAAFCASTPIAFWNAAKAASNSFDAYWDEFQTPPLLKAELRNTSGEPRWP